MKYHKLATIYGLNWTNYKGLFFLKIEEVHHKPYIATIYKVFFFASLTFNSFIFQSLTFNFWHALDVCKSNKWAYLLSLFLSLSWEELILLKLHQPESYLLVLTYSLRPAKTVRLEKFKTCQ
jgi:hypothetical protein